MPRTSKSKKRIWIAAFVDYVTPLRLRAVPALIAAAASAAHGRFNEYGPVDVANVIWLELAIGD